MGKKIELADDVSESLEAICLRDGRSSEDLAGTILRSHLASFKSERGTTADALYPSTRLRIAEETLAAIVDAVITVDRHAAIEYMNPAAEELSGWSGEDANGRAVATVLQISSPDADEIAHDLVQTCLQDGRRAEVLGDAVLVNRSGREFAIDGVASPLHNQSGNIIGAALVLRDITARKEAEKALTTQRIQLEQLVEKRTADLKALQEELLNKERLAALGHLTATVSHEIRNPLGTIRNSMHVLEQRVKGRIDGVDDLLDRIDRNIKRCTRIISELLDFAHVGELHCEKVDIDRWLTKVLDEMEVHPPIKLERDMASGAFILGDPERLRRAIVNVCDNACQAMLDDPRDVERRLTVRAKQVGGRLELSFSDTGPGMSEQVRSQIFRELFSTKRFGVGLGLPIVKQIVEQHGGEVHVQTAQGAGTKVIMRLPIRARNVE